MKLDKTIKFPSRQDLGPASGSTPYTPEWTIDRQEAVIAFPDGVPAFEDSKRFVLLLNEGIKPFVYLKSLDVAGLGFVCVDPFLVYPGYSVNLSAKNLSLLQLKDPSMALVLSFVTTAPDFKNTTCNLLAPIVINIDKFIGGQVILENYPVKFRVWEAIEKLQAAAGKEG